MLSNARVISMEQGDVYEYRAFFRKTGRAKYISHLDLYRTIQRSFKRAGLPVWHTLGFNPHIYLTFPLPISLGYEGVRESFDFRLCSDMSAEEVIHRLNGALPEGIIITGLDAPVCKAESIAMADYTLTLSGGGLDGEALLEKWEAFLSQKEIIAEKRTKKGPRPVDLKPMILGAAAAASGETLQLQLTLTAGISVNLNPTLVTDTFGGWAGFEPDYHSIRRDAVRCGDGTEFR